VSAAPPPAPSTARFARFLTRSYPAETVRISLLLGLASAAEALGVAALIPTLYTAIGAGAAPAARDPLGRLLERVLDGVGVPYTLVTLVLVIAVFMTGKGLCQWLAWRAAARAMAHIATDLRLRLVGNLFRARWPYFTQQPVGALATAVGHQTYVTAHACLALWHSFGAVLLVLVYLAAIAVVSPWSLPLSLAVGLLLVAPLRGLLRYVRAVAESEAQAQHSLIAHLLGAIQSIKPIRAMGREEGFESLARADADDLRASIARKTAVSYLMPTIQEPILVFGIALFVVAGRFVLQMDLPTLAIVVFALWRCGAQVTFAHRGYRELAVAEPHYRQLQNLIDASEEARERHAGTRPVPSGPLAIDLDRVTFAHGAAPVLEALSLSAPAGAITVLVGESGIGKSTLIDLLLVLHQPAEGRILVNGVPLHEIDVAAWRGALGYVPQDTTLLHGTILENVRLGDAAIGEEAVREALVAAGAWDWVAGLDHGLRTTVGEHGARVSGGQRQRIAIARALVRRPRLLLLDEFTASLDAQTEASILDTVRALRPRVTLVIATHQPALVAIADVVYRIEHRRATRLDAAGPTAAARRAAVSPPSSDPADAGSPPG
jgi:ATP-binding cassette subfamily C protein